MKVLICASGNTGRLSPFVQEQAESLKILGIQIDYFLISKSLRPRLKRAFILPDVMGSDHCPVGIELG